MAALRRPSGILGVLAGLAGGRLVARLGAARPVIVVGLLPQIVGLVLMTASPGAGPHALVTGFQAGLWCGTALAAMALLLVLSALPGPPPAQAGEGTDRERMWERRCWRAQLIKRLTPAVRAIGCGRRDGHTCPVRHRPYSMQRVDRPHLQPVEVIDSATLVSDRNAAAPGDIHHDDASDRRQDHEIGRREAESAVAPPRDRGVRGLQNRAVGSTEQGIVAPYSESLGAESFQRRKVRAFHAWLLPRIWIGWHPQARRGCEGGVLDAAIATAVGIPRRTPPSEETTRLSSAGPSAR
jgi:hypothetical protein